MAQEYTGQLIGGPDEGNLVTATVPKFKTCVTYRHELDGTAAAASVTVVNGWYTWDEERQVFKWRLDR